MCLADNANPYLRDRQRGNYAMVTFEYHLCDQKKYEDYCYDDSDLLDYLAGLELYIQFKQRKLEYSLEGTVHDIKYAQE